MTDEAAAISDAALSDLFADENPSVMKLRCRTASSGSEEGDGSGRIFDLKGQPYPKGRGEAKSKRHDLSQT